MNYTPLVLFLLGTIGVLLHNLVSLNKLNKSTNGNVDLTKYLKLEVYSILISLIVVGVCVITSQEIRQLEQVGKWLGLAFVAMGYTGQSLLISFMGKAKRVIENDIDEGTNKKEDETKP